MKEETREAIITRVGNEICDMFEDVYEVRDAGTAPALPYCTEASRKCITAKADLIAMLEKHPKWDEENLRVHFDADFIRPVDKDGAINALLDLAFYLSRDVKNENGGLREAVEYSWQDENCIWRRYYLADWHFSDDNEHREDRPKMDSLDPLFCLGSSLCLREWNEGFARSTTITPEFEKFVKAVMPSARIHAGTKSTRALFKLLSQYDWETHLKGKNSRTYTNPYTLEEVYEDDLTRARQAYTVYADAMNEFKVTRHTVLSVNPMDFLRMSYGNSWQSCHRISTDDESSGCYSAGCWSYAYDKQTMIFFTVDGNIDESKITYAPKYNRQLYFWNGKALSPSRLYPQGFDGDSAEYKLTREIVEQIVADATGYGNMWKKLPYDSCVYDEVTGYRIWESRGLHYPDYFHSRYPIYTPSFLASDVDDEGLREFAKFTVGSTAPICVVCGQKLSRYDYTDAPICRECAESSQSACDCCGDYYAEDDLTYIEDEDIYVCEDCLENNYVWDEYNDSYVRSDDAEYVRDYGWVRRSTLECYDDFFWCEGCEHWFYRNYEESEELDGYTYCSNCFEDRAQECSRCGALHDRDSMYQTEDGKWVCDDCVTPDEFVCSRCGKLHSVEDELGEVIGTQTYCKDCYEKYRRVCECCGKPYYARRVDEQPICPSCTGRFYTVDWDTGKYVCNIADSYPENGCIIAEKVLGLRYELLNLEEAKRYYEAEMNGQFVLMSVFRLIDKEHLGEDELVGYVEGYKGKRYELLHLHNSFLPRDRAAKMRELALETLRKFIEAEEAKMTVIEDIA